MPSLPILIAGRSQRLFLDGRSDVAAAFSLRRVRSSYRGALVRIRRSSDSAEADFGAGRGRVEWSSVLSFIGAGNGFVSKWYDQSGNGRDLSQSTAANQPQAILASNGLPSLLLDGSNGTMATSAFTLNQAWSFGVVYRRLAQVGNDEYVFDGLTANSGALIRQTTATATDNGMFAGSFLNSDAGTSMPLTTRGVVGGCFNGASSLEEVNAATIASFTGSPGAGNPGGFTLGSQAGGTANTFSNMEIQEFVAFNTAHSSAQIKADNALMRAAWRF